MTEIDRAIQIQGELSKMGYSEMTVSSLITLLAGLPPMMSVYALVDSGVLMFVNGVTVTEGDGNSPPMLQIRVDSNPVKLLPDSRSYDEKIAEKAELGMRLNEDFRRNSEQ